MTEPNLTLITLASISGACGIALLFVGYLVAMLMALGQKQWLWGIGIFVFVLPALAYGFLQRKSASYAWQLSAVGWALFLIFCLLLWYELGRLGLSFTEVMATTRPKH